MVAAGQLHMIPPRYVGVRAHAGLLAPGRGLEHYIQVVSVCLYCDSDTIEFNYG